jgi:hypothetical protein
MKHSSKQFIHPRPIPTMHKITIAATYICDLTQNNTSAHHIKPRSWLLHMWREDERVVAQGRPKRSQRAWLAAAIRQALNARGEGACCCGAMLGEACCRDLDYADRVDASDMEGIRGCWGLAVLGEGRVGEGCWSWGGEWRSSMTTQGEERCYCST